MILFLAFSLAAALFFSFTEHALVQAFWPNAYLDGDFFYYPGLAVSIILVVASATLCGVLGVALRRWRRELKAPEAAASLLFAVVFYALLAEIGVPLSGLLSSQFVESTAGKATSVALVFLASFLILAGVLRSLIPAANSGVEGKAFVRSGITFAAAGLVAAGLTVFSWRALHDALLTLYAVLLIGLLFPAVGGRLLYAVLSRASAPRVHGIARLALGVAILIVAFLWAAQVSRHLGARWVYAAVPVPFIFLILGIAALRNVKAALVYLPGALVVAILAMPVVDDLWRPRISEGLYPGDHLLLISVDTLRIDAISAYNDQTPPTPRIDALLADGARYTRAWSASSWTLPTMVSILSGVSPAAHKADDFGSRVPENLDMLAEELRRRGYATEAVVENLLLGPERGMAQGFDRYALVPSLDPHATLAQQALAVVWPARFNLKGGARGIVETAWRRIRRHRDGKLFLWLHVYDPHAPYHPPAAFWPEGIPRDVKHPDVSNGPIRGRVSKEVLQDEMYPLYLGEVQYVDHSLGLLIDRMKTMGGYDGATLAFTSDHGEEFGEQGRWGHGNTPVETLVRMPLGLKSVGIEPGTIVDAMVDTSGMMTTALHLSDESFRPPSHLIPGWPLKASRTDDRSTTTVFMTSVPRESRHEEGLVFGERPWKYVFNRSDETERLYDLQADLEELNPVTEAYPDLLARGRRLYEAHRHNAERIRKELQLDAREDVDYTDEVIEELRKLGYMN